VIFQRGEDAHADRRDERRHELLASFGLPLGMVAGWADYAVRLISMLGLSFPAFVSGILLLIVFAIQLDWFPVLGSSGSGWPARLHDLASPALNLGLIMTAYVVRVTRSSMLGVLGEDYIRTARAKGVQMTTLHRAP
jgi:ABC-type dipeptide/oligopeptide/nickel transport system permease component